VIAGDERLPVVADVPTANEAGLPEFKDKTWTGLYLPKGGHRRCSRTRSDTIGKTSGDPCQAVHRHRRRPAENGAPRRAYMQQLVISEVDRWRHILASILASRNARLDRLRPRTRSLPRRGLDLPSPP
jgi:tripartite-type tricarboxylate transporter receptor subunit TctC